MPIVGVFGIFVLVFILFFLRIPVAFAMAAVGFFGFWFMTSFQASSTMLGMTLWSTFSKYSLMVIPFFVFMGEIAYYSEVNKRLYSTAYKWIGHIKGGIAMATIVACSMFSAICGSNAATAATMATVAIPEMKKFKYNSILSTGSIASGSTLGVIIPPSVVLIVIGIYTGLSISKLFYGSVPAGILLTLMLLITTYFLCKIHPDWGPTGPRYSLKEKIKALPGSIEIVVLFLLVMLGLYKGFFTPTEAGAAGSALAILISLITRRLSWNGFKLAILDTLRISCMIILLVTGALIFGRFLAITRLPFEIASWVVSLNLNRSLIMFFIFLIYIIGGALMDALALLLVTIPIFFPVAVKLGYDPIWFGVVITVVTTLGAITPPVGVSIYIISEISRDIPLENIFKGVFYYIPAYILCLIIFLIFPEIITSISNLVH